MGISEIRETVGNLEVGKNNFQDDKVFGKGEWEIIFLAADTVKGTSEASKARPRTLIAFRPKSNDSATDALAAKNWSTSVRINREFASCKDITSELVSDGITNKTVFDATIKEGDEVVIDSLKLRFTPLEWKSIEKKAL